MSKIVGVRTHSQSLRMGQTAFHPPPSQLVVFTRLSSGSFGLCKHPQASASASCPVDHSSAEDEDNASFAIDQKQMARYPRLLLPIVPLATSPRQNLHPHRLPSVPCSTRKRWTRETTSPFSRRSAHCRRQPTFPLSALHFRYLATARGTGVSISATIL